MDIDTFKTTTRTVVTVVAAVLMITSVMAPAMALDTSQELVSDSESLGPVESTSSQSTEDSPESSSQKADSKVSPLVEELVNEAASGDSVSSSSLVTQSKSGETQILVQIDGSSGQADAVVDAVSAQGGSINVREGSSVEAFIPPNAVDAIAGSSAVERIGLPVQVVSTGQGSIVSEGLSNMNASELHNQGINGTGVTIAIIDSGFNVSNPEIKNNVAGFQDFEGDGMDNTSGLHGTAVAEIVVDTAPNASIHLLEAGTTRQIESAINNYVEPINADVATMSLGTYIGPFDGTSLLDYEIYRSFGNGTTWFISAGNAANGQHLNQEWTDADGDGWHDFETGDRTLNVTASGPFSVYVNWDDFPLSNEDYDVYLNDSNGNEVDNSTVAQNGNAGPYEIVGANSGGTYNLSIKNFSANGTADFDIFATDGVTLIPNTSTRSITRPATEETAITVGATYYDGNVLEPFSSRGPLIDGDRKPEVVAPDGVSTTVYGDAPNGFFGTSAAAPHAAGVAALVLDGVNEAVTSTELRNSLLSSATPLVGSEPNNQTGFGLVNATGALEAIQQDGGGSSGTVTATSIEYVAGTQNTSPINVDTQLTSEVLQISLTQNDSGNFEEDMNLSKAGADQTTQFRVNLTIEDFKPRVTFGIANVSDWNVTTSGSTHNVSFLVQPLSAARNFSVTATTPDEWPEENQTADGKIPALALIHTSNLAQAPQQVQDDFEGAAIMTNAQVFTPPQYNPPQSEGDVGNITISLAAPHFAPDGVTVNQGFYKATIPQALLNGMGVDDTSALIAKFENKETALDITETSDGVILETDDFNYSSGTFTVTQSTESTKPNVTRAIAVDLTDADGNVTDGDQVRVSVNASDGGSGIDTVTADASDFGNGTVTLSNVVGNMYNGSFTVDGSQASANGSYAIPITATDNDGNVNDTEQTNTLQLNTSGGAAPTITAYSVRTTGIKTFDVSFNSSDQLSEIHVNVTDSSGSLVRSIRESDLSEFQFSDGTYNYANGTTLDKAGTYWVNLTVAKDSNGNDAGGQNSSSVRFVVESATVTANTSIDTNHLGKDIVLSGGLLQVQLENKTKNFAPAKYDLRSLGATENTEFKINITLRDYDPRLLLGAGQEAEWNRTFDSSGLRTVNITVMPANVQYNESKLFDPSRDWSISETADVSANVSVGMAIDDLGFFPSSRQEILNGTLLMTDAQEFGSPQYDSTNKTLSLYVAAPHTNTKGNVNNGFFDAFIPDALINDWGVAKKASNFQVTAMGSSTQPASTEIESDGVRLFIPIHYSEGDVEISPQETGTNDPVINDATLSDGSGDDIVTDGESVTLEANVTDADGDIDTVTADASIFGEGIVELTHASGDIFNVTFAADRTSATVDDGKYRVTITANDTANNVTSAETGSFELDLWNPPESQIVNATDEVDIWDRSMLPLRADESVAAIQIANANWFLSFQSGGTQLGTLDLNKDPIAVYDTNTDIPLSFDDDRAVAAGTLGYNTDPLDVTLVAARLEANQSATLSEISSLSGIRGLLTQDNANTNASFEIVSNDQLNSDGDGSFTYTPSKPGQYVLFLASNETDSGGFSVDGSGNISISGQTTILGFDQVTVQRASSDVIPSQSAYATGDSASFDVNTTGAIETDPGENVTHLIAVYDESTFTGADFTIDVDGEVSSDFNISENVTLEHSIETVKGVASSDGNASFFGVTAEQGGLSGPVPLSAVLNFIETNTSLSGDVIPQTSATGSTVWNASITLVNSTAEDTIEVGSLAEWPTGEYRFVHLATDEDGTEFAANTGTITFDETQTPANVTYSTAVIAPNGTVNLTQTSTGSVTVANDGGLDGDYSVELLVNGTAVGSESGTVAGGDSFTVNFSHTFSSTGTFNLTLVGGGDILTTEIITVEEPDTTPPVIDLDSPAEGAVAYGTTVTVNITDDENTVASAFAMVDNTVTNLTGDANPRSIPTGGITEGLQAITVNATDSEGNFINKTFTFDFVSAPIVKTIHTPAPGSTVGDATPWINVSYADDRHGANETGVDWENTTLRIDGEAVDLSNAAVNDGTNLNVTVGQTLSDETHTATLVLVDNASHVTQRKWKFSVDSTEPDVDITSSESIVSTAQPATVSLIANDDALDSVTFKVYNDSGLQDPFTQDITSSAKSTTGAVNIQFTGINDSTTLETGDYRLEVNATDTSGNLATANVTVLVDNEKPEAVDVKVGNASQRDDALDATVQTYLTNDTAELIVNATDGSDGSGITSATVAVRRAGSLATAIPHSGIGMNSTQTIDLTSLSTGQYKLGVRLVDAAGNVQFVSETNGNSVLNATIDLDRTPPGLSTVITQKNSSYLWVNVTSSETLAGAPSAKLVNETADVNSQVSFIESGQQTSYNGTVAKPNADGIYNVTVTGADRAGNTGSDEESTLVRTESGDAGSQLTIVNERTGSFLVINLSTDVDNELVTISGSGQTAFNLPAGAQATKFANLEFNNSAIENVTVGIRARTANIPSWAQASSMTLRFWNTTSKQWEALTTTYTENYDIPNYDGQFNNTAYWTATREHLSEHAPTAEDTTDPTITINDPIAQEYPIDTTQVDINVSLNDAETGINASTITLLINSSDETDSATITQVDANNYTLTDVFGGLNPGDTRNVTVVTEDESGNQAVETTIFSIADDTQDPTVQIDSPEADQSFPIGTTSVTLNATLRDDGGIDADAVTVEINGTDITDTATITTIEGSNATVNVTASNLEPGPHNFTVNATDIVGKHTEQEVVFTIEEDTTEPTVDITEVSPDPQPANTTSVELTADVTDAGLGVDDTTIDVYFDDIEVTSAATVEPIAGETGNFTVTYNATGLSPDTQHNLTIVADDEAANTGSATEIFNISEDTTAPAIVSLSPANNSVQGTQQATRDVTISIELTDDATGVDTGAISLLFEGQSVTPTISQSGGVTTIEYTAQDLTEGTYSFSLTARDNAGNTLSNTSSFTVQTDDVAPTASFTASTTTPDVDETVTFDASGSSDNLAIDTFEWDFTDDGTVDATGESVDHAFTSAGEKTVKLTVTDTAGNEASTTMTIDVQEADTGPGTGPGPSPAPSPGASVSKSVSGSTVSVEISNAGAGSSVTVQFSGTPVATAGADITLDSLDLDFRNAADFDLSVSNTRGDVPRVNDRLGDLGYINVAHDASDDDLDTVTFTFRVKKSQVQAMGLSADQVSLYRYHDGEWTELSTSRTGESTDYYRYSATSPGLSVFAISQSSTQAATFQVTDASLDPSELQPGDSTTVTATIENTGDRDGTFTAELRVDGVTVDQQDVSVPAGETETITFSRAFDDEGTYDVAVSETSAGSVNVAQEDDDTPTPTPTPVPPTVTATPTPTPVPPTATPTPTPTPTATPTPTPSPTPTSPGEEEPDGIPLIPIVVVILLVLALLAALYFRGEPGFGDLGDFGGR